MGKKLKQEYRYLIVGAGSGGLTIASGLKRLGKDYLVVSRNIGGECTNYGCVPSKSVIYWADKYHRCESEQDCEKIKGAVFQKTQSVVENIKEIDRELLGDERFVLGAVKFWSKNQAKVVFNDGHESALVKFSKCIICTGSAPRVTEIPNLDREKVLTNENLFKLTEVPKSLTVIGGGPIGLEMAAAFAKLGSEVSVVSRSRIMKKDTEGVVQYVRDGLKSLGVKLFEGYRIIGVQNRTLKLACRNDDTVELIPEAEYYLVATGRVPNTDLDLEKAGIKYTEAGIQVNRSLRTSNRNIFAIGDCTPSPKFTHLANNQGVYLVKKLLLPFLWRRRVVLPYVTFTEPFVATVGVTEGSEKVRRLVIDFADTDRAMIEQNEQIYGEVYFKPLTGRIVGASIAGEFSEHAINFFTLAVQKRLSLFKLGGFITPYPTYMNALNRAYGEFLRYYAGSFRNELGWFLQRNATVFLIIALLLGSLFVTIVGLVL